VSGEKRYEADGITVTYDAGLCIHAARCVEGLPEVFDVGRRPWIQPANAAADLIPQADVVGVTSSAFINHTFDGLLALCRPDAFVVALGPTTPFSPVLFDHGIHVLAGSDVVDETLVLQALGQGASFREIPGVRRIAIAAPGTRP